MRPMTMGELRFDAGKSALFAARRSRLTGSIVCHAHQT